MTWYFWLVFSLCLFFLITTTLTLVAFFLYIKNKSHQNYDDYTLSDQAEACSQDGTPCLCKIGSSSQKICFAVDGNTMTLQIPFLKWSQQLPPLDTLTNDETQPFMFSIKSKKIGAFRHPCFSDSTVVCLRNMDDMENPQRLCFQIDSNNAFLSGPTHYDMLAL